ncbi:MAG: SIMPL domain-containing protein [Hyphomicrobiales bacterium]|nr:SIMPL domain-containing protein [Hyphomicrobiales bacterium]MBV8827253.1 SIMPL domain-containing protein [Hyphomicrobiales bacterium]MBV9426646.1 SIMPL domain-containing protein [Bradyrhizobiaceae bacterium]
MAAMLVASQVHAQHPESPAESRITVVGVGRVHVVPDQARIRSGVTTRAKTVKEASDANSKLMSTITTTLLASGIAQNDIQTSRFSVQPVYAPAQPGVEPKLSGYSVSNQVEVIIRQMGNVGDILDRLVSAGATDIGNIEFLHADPSKPLDQAREAAVADARHKAELYARAAGVSLGRVLSITEDSGHGAPMPLARAAAPMAASVPIASGEDTLEAHITVAYEIPR